MHKAVGQYISSAIYFAITVCLIFICQLCHSPSKQKQFQTSRNVLFLQIQTRTMEKGKMSTMLSPTKPTQQLTEHNAMCYFPCFHSISTYFCT